MDYNQHNVEFTPATAGQPAQMRLQMQGSSGARVQPKCPRQMYGQFEATAKVTSARGAVTAFYVSGHSGNMQQQCGLGLAAAVAVLWRIHT